MAFSPITFGKEAVDELKKVTWPTRPDIKRLTIAVLAISVFVGIFLGVIDLVLERVMAIVIGR
jgi:preprotein translocase subunit SecE